MNFILIELNDIIYRVKKTILFFYLWFVKPYSGDDHYYYYGLFDSWQRAVNHSWDNMDIYQQIDHFSKHWVYKR